MTSLQLAGKHLFEQHCLACHNPNESAFVGPGLRGITQRRPLNWLVKWIQNPQKVLQKRDRYALRLFQEYQQTQMPAFEQLSKANVMAILSYIELDEASQISTIYTK